MNNYLYFIIGLFKLQQFLDVFILFCFLLIGVYLHDLIGVITIEELTRTDIVKELL